jgi:hypothetical protein
MIISGALPKACHSISWLYESVSLGAAVLREGGIPSQQKALWRSPNAQNLSTSQAPRLASLYRQPCLCELHLNLLVRLQPLYPRSEGAGLVAQAGPASPRKWKMGDVNFKIQEAIATPALLSTPSRTPLQPVAYNLQHSFLFPVKG